MDTPPPDVEARHSAELELIARDADALLRDLVADDSPLRDGEAWYLLEVVQRLDVPGEPGAWTEHGIRTRFAD